MEYSEAKEQFINTWGELGLNWGINKTMGQIHALLMVKEQPMCCESIMCELQISRGNANMNLRALIDWRLVHKKIKIGTRKEFFVAEKDIWKAFRMIIKKRKQKELSPLLDLLDQVSELKVDSQEAANFKKVISELQLFSNKADKTLERLVCSQSNFLVSSVIKIIK